MCRCIVTSYPQKESTVKENDRQISVLPTISIVFERLLMKKVEKHMNQICLYYYVDFAKDITLNEPYLIRFLEKKLIFFGLLTA